MNMTELTGLDQKSTLIDYEQVTGSANNNGAHRPNQIPRLGIFHVDGSSFLH